jgi:hypothetical protein
MSDTPIADMVELMIAQGMPVATIPLAIRAVELSRDASHNVLRDMRSKDAERQRNYRNRKRNRGGMAVPAEAVSHENGRDMSRDNRNDALILPSIQEGTLDKKKELPAVNEDTGRRQRKKQAVALPDDWMPKPAHYEAAKKLNLSSDFVERKADDMRIWAKSNDSRKADWDMTFHGFLRRDSGGHHGNGNRNFGANRIAESGARPPPIVTGVGRAFAKRFGAQHADGGGQFRGSPDPSCSNGAERGAETGNRAAPAQLEFVAQPDARKGR